MDGQPSAPPNSTNKADHSALLSTHAVPHSASEPAKLASDSGVLQASQDDSSEHDSTTAKPSMGGTNPDSHPSPPPVSSTDHQAFSALRPTPSDHDRDVVANTAAVAARVRNLDKKGNFEDEFDPNPGSSMPCSSTSPVTLIKNIPDAASKKLDATIAAPVRTLDSIKQKLKTPSTGQKSKSDIPNSLGQIEHDMRHNQHSPGNLSPVLSSSNQNSNAQPEKSSSFNSLLGSKSKKPHLIPTLMQRGPRKSESSTYSNHALSPRHSSVHPRRKASAIQESSDEDQHPASRDEEEEEQEEEEEVVRQRIKDQQKRLEDLDEAQTVGLLRTQQEAGIEPPQSSHSPSKPSWLVGLPLFGNGSDSAKAKHDDAEDAQGASSRRSSFNRSRRRAPAAESNGDHGSRTTARRIDGPRRANSEKLKDTPTRGRQSHARSASASRASRSKTRDGAKGDLIRRASGFLSPPRRRSNTWTSKLRTRIPIKEFPLQGAGRESEFNQEAPIWSRQPWKYMYFSYFGLSVGLYHLPKWAITSALPSKRGRRDWSWKKATMVQLFRHGTQLTFRTRTSLGRDLQKEVPHSKTVRCKFTWVKPVDDRDVRGELRRAMLLQKVHTRRTCGFWYGDVAEQGKHQHGHLHRRRYHGQNVDGEQPQEAQLPGSGAIVDTLAQRDGDGLGESTASLGTASQNTKGRNRPKEELRGIGRPAEAGEKVLYHLHGGAYWIGTAHEKDVTAAVNTESLRYMAEIYRQKEAEAQNKNDSAASGQSANTANGAPSSSSSSSSSNSNSNSTTASPYAGKLLRSFSLDYRLCVPGRPRAGSYPAALLDALSGYLYLVRELGFKEENIIIAGDSAGGNLALALCRYLRDEREEMARQPGSLLLMSPWVDVSRSHSGPTGAPNLDSTVYTNQKSDIISSMLAFRNTAVSAFLGDLPARETYRNPYISPVSLQLPLENGGEGPHYGFHGFPKRIYITTGSAEISYDQHLTLAHRLAAGTKRGRPVYSGDRLSAGVNARELCERRNRPRPKEMLDQDQDRIEVTPMEELQGIKFGVNCKEEGHDGGDGIEGYADIVVDGEPTPMASGTSDGDIDSPPYPQTTTATQDTKVEEEGEREEGQRPKGKPRMRANPPPEPREKQDRIVVFDEVKDAVHDYLLFKWFEPERSCTWRRIAKWIDEV
ncbi:uncharacterized protein MEPE_01006 [Melanopsichium pennsylvanicum]|uniref:Alpha/beta hydrolase fold-3 domain-containing protein n=2 Tax=Melanopsichium pennsylvanicum TaxID=63383 RepID=A0AAJ4XHP2_9BASI|nr:alpha beta-hydrolase [Melanopsichium pennsylvanicum 4]SNX82300.1 uncharacterized protein MEPE_01006 [Melanopsichium pennsylvanicum]